MVDTTTKIGHIQYVVKKRKEDLLPIIQIYVLPGSTIWTNKCDTTLYTLNDQLSTQGYTLLTVTQSKEFKSTDRSSTNFVKDYCSQLKRFCRKADVLKSHLLREHIDEFLYRNRFKTENMNERWTTFIGHIKARSEV
uniref:ISXO2-like transposase domain-containing protein n=2 Tax=Cacopsylla melanoneura TaxID=428564 RepID=A0A8D8QMJ5_9HEMI